MSNTVGIAASLSSGRPNLLPPYTFEDEWTQYIIMCIALSALLAFVTHFCFKKQDTSSKQSHFGAICDEEDNFVCFLNAVDNGDIQLEYYQVSVLEFNQITSADSDGTVPDLRVLHQVEGYFSSSSVHSQLQSIASDSPAVKYVTLPFLRSRDPNFHFFGKSPVLFIRSQYISLFHEILSRGDRKHFILDGNSGVGKTCFIYYFMYMLRQSGASFRGYNCGHPSTDHISDLPIVASDKSHLYTNTVDWAIADSTARLPYGISLSTRCLYVTSDQSKVADVRQVFKHDNAIYFSFPQWSYVDTCAAGFCPVLIPRLPNTSPFPFMQYFTKQNDDEYYVLHPLFILSRFLALRSTPRELRIHDPIRYVMKLNPFQDRPNFMFLHGPLRLQRPWPWSLLLLVLGCLGSFCRAFRDRLHCSLLRAYSCTSSVFDQSVEHIRDTRHLYKCSKSQTPNSNHVPNDHYVFALIVKTPFDPMPLPPAQGPLPSSQNDLALSLGVNNHEKITCILPSPASLSSMYSDTSQARVLGAGIDGIVEELAMALNTNTCNSEFCDLFTKLLPVISLSISQQMADYCTTLLDKATYVNTNEKTNITISGMLAFRRHLKVLIPNDVPQDVADDVYMSTRMPQFLSMIDGYSVVTVRVEGDLFFHDIRCTPIMNMLAMASCLKRAELLGSIRAFMFTVFSYAGVGFFFEFFSLVYLRQYRTHSLLLLPSRENDAVIRITLRGTRYCRFSDDSHVLFDDMTMFIPTSSSYPAIDAVGMCEGIEPGVTHHLVFYQSTISSTHPIRSIPTSTAKVTEWNRKATQWANGQPGEVVLGLPIVVFVTCNDAFKSKQSSYTSIGLSQQYVLYKSMDDFLLSLDTQD